MSDSATDGYLNRAYRAWRIGYVAGRRGISEEANPHAADSALARAWKFGLINGRNKPLRLVHDSDSRSRD